MPKIIKDIQEWYYPLSNNDIPRHIHVSNSKTKSLQEKLQKIEKGHYKIKKKLK